MSALAKAYLTPQQYLEIERHAKFKSEYWNGQMYAERVPASSLGGGYPFRGSSDLASR